jgi:hypothetical protein
VPSPDAAAALRAPTPAPTSPVATTSYENEHPNHGKEMRSFEPRRLDILYEDARPVSRINQDNIPDTTPDPIPGPDRHENDSEQPGPRDELHTDSANDSLADVSKSAPHQAEAMAEKECDDVEVDTRRTRPLPESRITPHH